MNYPPIVKSTSPNDRHHRVLATPYMMVTTTTTTTKKNIVFDGIISSVREAHDKIYQFPFLG